MTFTEPLPFTEAQKLRGAKRIVPSAMGSAEWRGVAAAIRERSMFSARVTNAELLQELSSRIEKILNPERIQRTGADGETRWATVGMDYATGRAEIKDYLKSISYKPEPGTEGTLQDLSSNGRINLILRTNVEQAQGFGQWEQGQDEAILDQWPAQELFRAESRKEERDWLSRWKEAAQAAGDGNAYRVAADTGRMIALKDSGVWEMLGTLWDDSLGQPYPPFAFRSGMWVRDVDWQTAKELGLLPEGHKVQPQRRNFNDGLEMVTPESIVDGALKAALGADLTE